MKTYLLASMAVCALGATLAPAESPPAPPTPPPARDPGLVKPGPADHPNRLPDCDLELSGPKHNPALLNPLPEDKINRLLGGLEPQKFVAGQQLPRITYNFALLGDVPGEKANRLPSFDPQKFSGDVQQSGAGHDLMLLKPRPEDKINHLPPLTAAPSRLEKPVPGR